MRVCGFSDDVVSAECVAERDFCVRKTEPWADLWVVVRRVASRVRNWDRLVNYMRGSLE